MHFRGRKLLATFLSLSIISSVLSIIGAAPAQAVYGSCGNVLGANAATQSSINSIAKLTVTPKHGTIFYIDSRRGLNASYVAYSITNTDTSTKTNLWVKLSNFAAVSGSSLVSLANVADNMQQIPALAPSASMTVFFLITTNKSTTVGQKHTVEVFSGDPRLTSTGAAATGCEYTFNRIDQTISANANKVTSVSVSTTSPVLGGTVVITVNGVTGNGGAGDATGDKDVMWVSPASVASWPTRALRLESTQIQIKRQGKTVTSTHLNTLTVLSINSGGSAFTSKTLYTSTYTFRVIGGASTNPTVKPIAQIASGSQMKHTGSYGTLPTINLTSLLTPITVTKTAAAAAYTPTSCSASTKIAVRFTITARLAGGSAGTVALDEIVDLPPISGSTFDTQASQATYSDATPLTNAALGTPKTITGETPVKLHWTGPFYINGTTPATFSYTMCVDKAAGSYTNTAYAYVGSTIVGSNSLQVSCVIATTNGTTFALSTTCNTAKPAQPQTITFGALDPVGVGSTTQLWGTSTSGLLVVFSTSSSSSICTVAYNGTTGFYEVTTVSAGTCILNANQPGDVNFSAASQVSQNLTIKTGQYISVSATASMLTSATQNFTATSLKISDNTSTGLAVTMTSLTLDLCTVAANPSAPNFRVTSLTITGVCSLVATQSGDGTYGPAPDIYVDINIGSLQTINFTNPGNQSSASSPSSPITISATSVIFGSSTATNLQVVFASITPDVCDISTSGSSYVTPTISGGVSSTTLVKFTAGVCTLAASQGGDATYTPATDVQVTFTIGQTQVITFATLTDAKRSTNTKSISASTTSSLVITFTSETTGICTVGGGSLSGSSTTATITYVSGGTCVITASQAGSGAWYAATPVTQTFLITGASVQSITFTQSNTNIDTSPVILTATATSGLPVTFQSSTTSVCTVSEIFVTLKTIGDCTIIAYQIGDVTYAAATGLSVTFVVFAKPTISFTQANVTVASLPQSLALSSTDTYLAITGATATGLTVTYTSSTTPVCEITSGATLSLKTVGTCTIVASQGAVSPYYLAADSVTVNFNISTGQTITFGALSAKTYGDSTFNLSASATSTLTVTFTLTTGAGVCSLTGATVTILAAGSCSFTASQSGDANYTAATPVLRPLTVNKKALTFTAIAANKSYDSLNSASLSLSALSGVINSDDVSISAGQVTGTFNTPNVGNGKPVAVTLGASVLAGAKAGNYSTTVSNSPTANIAAKPITITVVVANRAYDGTISATISATSLNGAEIGDSINIDETKVSGVFANPDKADSKAVTVTLASGVLTGLDASNYTVAVAGTPSANITARPVTVVADSKTKSVMAADPIFSYSITAGSLVSRLGTPDLFSGTLTRANLGTNTAGSYAITVGSLALSSNYSLTITPGTLTITDKIIPLICWSTPAAINYGTALSAPELNAIAKADCATGSTLTGTFLYTPANGVLEPGTYTLSVTFTPGAPDNATYSSASGTVTLTVNSKAITVTATSRSKGYGANDPALTYTAAVGALVGSDALSGLLVRSTGESAGDYLINQGTLTTANNPKYVINFVAANLTITRELITVTADALNKNYGGVDPVLTYQITSGSLQSGDTLSGVLTRAVGESFGTYTITQNTLTNINNLNYNITFVGAIFAVNKKPITITVGITNKQYDGNVSAAISSTSLNDVESGDLVTIDGTKMSGVFANPDKADGKSVTVTLAAGVLTGAQAGNYAVTVAGTPLANITARSVTVVANSKSKSATATDPAFTYSTTVGTLVSRLTVPDAFTGSLTRANLGTNTPGTYAITAGTLALSSNYSLTISPGTFTITDKILPLICWSTPTAITYGTELSATQLNAEARIDCSSDPALPGNYLYSPAIGVGLAAGTHTLFVTFTPTDTSAYSAANGTVSITFNGKSITVTADNKSITSGSTAPTFTISLAAGELVNVDGLSGATFTFSGSGYGPSTTVPTAAGTYSVTPSIATFTPGSASNYLISYIAGIFTVNAAPVTPAPVTPAPVTPAPVTPAPVTPAPVTPAPVLSPTKITPVLAKKTLPVKKVMLTSTTTASAPIVLAMIASTTGSTSNKSSLALILDATVNKSVVVRTPLPTTPTTPTFPDTSTPGGSSTTNSDKSDSTTKNGETSGNSEKATEKGNGNTQTTEKIFDNVPGFAHKLTSDISISLDMDKLQTQVKNEQALIQLDTNTGQVSVQPLNGWTGVLKVPTYMATDEAILEIENLITVNPEPANVVLIRPVSVVRTTLSWAKSITESVQKYEVRINGDLLCVTASTSCSVPRLIGPKTKVNVTAIGNEETRSTVEAGKYSLKKRIKVFTINFDEEKWEFTPAAIKKLDAYIKIIKSEGFTQAYVLGFTDSQGSVSTSLPLSKKRASATTSYLKQSLPGVIFQFFGLGETDPVKTGFSPKEFAANRRAEIYVK